MSIPPLVCSTPPPPDQCDDDKDPEDFDLQYNLSQEDDDDNYDYGSYSTYNHYQIPGMEKPNESIVTKVNENKNHEQPPEENTADIEPGTILDDTKFKVEEETNVEDLDLALDKEILENIESTDIISDNSFVENEMSNDVVPKEIDIPILSEADQDVLSPCELPAEDFFIGAHNLDDQSTSHVVEIVSENKKDIELTEEITSTTENFEKLHFPLEEPAEIIGEVSALSNDPIHLLEEKKTKDEDFGDFDDFQFASSIEKPAVVFEGCENPWETCSHSNDFGEFGDFKANFDSESSSNVTVEPTFKLQTCSNKEGSISTEAEKEDDDYGDFDDFKSSADVATSSSTKPADKTDTEEPLSNVSVLSLNLFENETEFLDNVNSFLNSIYDNELPAPSEDFKSRLDSQLSVTWGHLQEVDVRQPYMVNWNSSLPQKTLLKALCIDSRNILFGPKWTSNMPKFAATLTTAPLQPQKPIQLEPSMCRSEPVNPEKSASKPVSSWTDPLTSDGQEFTYAEALLLDLEHLMATLDQMSHNHSNFKISDLLSQACNTETKTENAVVEPGPTDMDVFEATLSSKSDKIFSSTPNVQPIRQINLPDTHIFTPTDSETPRSKTIHYDRSPAVLPQTIIDSSKPTKSMPVQSKISTLPSTSDNDDYWEFQNFRGASTSTSILQEKAVDNTESETPKPLTYGTQILQPIKMEPIMPTLNWPNPGEIKETYDDFSDFISINTPIQKTEEPSTSSRADIKPDLTAPEAIGGFGQLSSSQIAANKSVTQNVKESLDDDFDTFQSAAIPSNSKTNLGTLSNDTQPQKIADFDFAFPKTDVVSETPSLIKPEDNFVQNQMSFIPYQISNIKTTDLSTKNTPSSSALMAGSSLLQPIPANTSYSLPHTGQKSGQILQPLSLESISQINWPNPGMDLQDLSRFNPVDSVHTLKSDVNTTNHSKGASPVHSHKGNHMNQVLDDDWGEFVSSAPKQQQQQPPPKKQATFVDEEEWTDFISSSSVKPQNGLNTISLNVHTSVQKSVNATKFTMKSNQLPLDIPSLSIITPKSNNHKSFNDKHFQNL